MRRWIVYFKRYDANGIPQKWNEGFNAETKEDAIEQCKQKNGRDIAEIIDAIPEYQAATAKYLSSYEPDAWKNHRYGQWHAPDKR